MLVLGFVCDDLTTMILAMCDDNNDCNKNIDNAFYLDVPQNNSSFVSDEHNEIC